MPGVFVALLRGINVGGVNPVAMKVFAVELEEVGLTNITTYIQSGNIIFASEDQDIDSLSAKIKAVLTAKFNLDIPVLVLSFEQFSSIIKHVPKNWGADDEWKYNLLFLIPPYKMDAVLAGIGDVKPGIETITAGDGVLYQTISKKLFGRATTGKLASNPVYQQMTVRNNRTGDKILAIMQETAANL